jgi:hypothetical protein
MRPEQNHAAVKAEQTDAGGQQAGKRHGLMNGAFVQQSRDQEHVQAMQGD